MYCYKHILIICLIQLFPVTNASAEALTFAKAQQFWREANIDLRLALGAVQGAAGDRATADRRENPTFSVSSTALSPRAGLGAGGLRDKNADSVIRLEQVIERGDKRLKRTQGAQARLEAVRADAKEAERSGLIQLNAAYWDLKAAADHARLLDASAMLAHEALGAAEKRLAAGDISAADVSRLRVEMFRADNDARLAASDLQKAQLTMALMIGRGRDAADLSSADDWPTAGASMAPAPVSDERLDQRADVRAALMRLVAVESNLASARSLAKRDVTVGLQFEHYPTTADFPPNNTWGVSVSIPLFVAHAYEGEVLRASADMDQATDLVARARAYAAAEVRRAYSDLQSSQDRLARLEKWLLPEAEKVAGAAEFAFRKGATGLLDVLDARRSLRQAQLDAMAARSDFAKASFAMTMQFAQAVSE